MRRVVARVVLVGVVACAGAASTMALPASAQGGFTLTLRATTPKLVTFGRSVHFVGKLTPGKAGLWLSLRNKNGRILKGAWTRAHGTFSITYTPRVTGSVHAEFRGTKSHAIGVKVRPRLAASISNVLLFDVATVRGGVAPWDSGASVTAEVLRDGATVASRTVRLNSHSQFAFPYPIRRPGTFAVRVTYHPPLGLGARVLSSRHATPLPSLRGGSSGHIVSLLERRLHQLHYRLTGIDGRYDYRTGDAVMAFRKVQGMTRAFTVDAAVWHRLARPLLPHPRLRASGFHIEVNQTKQVLLTVRAGKVTNVIHVSTGKPSTPTRDGRFSVYSKIAGYSPHRLYYPSFFDGLRAVHGWPSVPSYAASHGCVRVPRWHTKWIFSLLPIGTTVLVYH